MCKLLIVLIIWKKVRKAVQTVLIGTDILIIEFQIFVRRFNDDGPKNL